MLILLLIAFYFHENILFKFFLNYILSISGDLIFHVGTISSTVALVLFEK